MKTHLLSSYGKRYVNVNADGSLIDHEYEMVGLSTFCGREFDTVQEAIAAGVKRNVPSAVDSEDVCKTCRRWSIGYAHQRELRLAGANKRGW